MKKSIFCDFSIKKIISEYKNKKFSPLELAKHTIDIFKTNESIYKAWTCFDEEKLLNQAKESEKRILNNEKIRKLEGIPVGVKDIMNTIDFPTQMGSEIWKNFTPGNDARVVFNLKREGAIVPGKTETAEFAVHTLGKTINPHDVTRTPGTSSTGSAVAVATGMVPATLGTQTAGSIVRPSSFCGIYGMKPSFGLIPRTGILKTTDTLDTVGFFSYHSEDLEIILNSLIVSGIDYPISDSILKNVEHQKFDLNKKIKIGVIFSHVWDYAASYAKQAFLNWVNKISEMFVVEEVRNQNFLSDAHTTHDVIYNKSLAYYFQEEFQQGELVSPVMRDMISKGLKTTLDEYKKALMRQGEISDFVDNLLKEYDFLISLSTEGHAPLRAEVEKPDTALIWTMSHVPVVSTPVFVSSEGLPFGVQLICRKYNDFKLLKLVQHLANSDFIPKKVNPNIFEKVTNKSLFLRSEV